MQSLEIAGRGGFGRGNAPAATRRPFRPAPQPGNHAPMLTAMRRLAGTALGVSRWYMLRRVIIPQSATAILSGILLAMGYAAGATAPIMVTAAVISAGMSGGLLDPVMALPYHLYILFSQHISMEKAYGTALLLVLLLLFLNITALMLRGRHGKGGY